MAELSELSKTKMKLFAFLRLAIAPKHEDGLEVHISGTGQVSVVPDSLMQSSEVQKQIETLRRLAAAGSGAAK